MPRTPTRPTTVEGLVALSTTIFERDRGYSGMMVSTPNLMDDATREAHEDYLLDLRDTARRIEGNRIIETRPIAETLKHDQADPAFQRLWRAGLKAAEATRFGR